LEKGDVVHLHVSLTPVRLQLDTKGRKLVITQPLFTPDELRRLTCEVLFEDYQFGSVCVMPPSLAASLARRARDAADERDAFAHQNCGIVVDVGYSSTHVVPIFDGRVLNYAARRVDVGGKTLVNYMKELISFRHFDVAEETHLVTDVFEQVCFVAKDFESDLRAAHAARTGGALRCRYLLPNYAERARGRLLADNELATNATADATKPDANNDGEQILTLTNERIVVPELLLTPSDIGLTQGGIGDAILQSVAACPREMAPALLAAVELVGALASLPNLQHRVLQQVCAGATMCCFYCHLNEQHLECVAQVLAASSDDIDVNVRTAPEPALAAWYARALCLCICSAEMCAI
jgi:actin-related protein 6